MTLDEIRAFAVTRSLFPPTTLQTAIDQLGFIQADPIRAPARAQDLTLRHRVSGYRAGDLERRYPDLAVEEDVFINYGFVTRGLRALMHPRTGASLAPTARNARAQALLAFVRERGTVHPREVDAHFSAGRVTNYWGGSSTATTHLLEAMQYKGALRVARRELGIRIYAAQEAGVGPMGAAARRARIDALVDVAVRKYAPLPSASLSYVVSRLRYAVPHWRRELAAALVRAKRRLAHEVVEGVGWYWPADEALGAAHATPYGSAERVRLLAPFDPVVWDRRRFELLWGWPYRFEAYTPLAKRKLGYYALLLLWRDRVIGWGNVSVKDGRLDADIGHVSGRAPRERAFKQELDAELERMRVFIASGV
ncbi:MAG TPA: crosslink repair DNA glycosylase YcaQ family protein [Vicinamibacterales bacterium]|nr:crosslink repair DNA glycosylase YcaQ family protein [Vicinamibacterales bacterium]